MNARRFCLINLLLFLTIFACGQRPSLRDLVTAAMHHLPVLLQKQALVNSARVGITDAGHSFLPAVDALEEVNIASANSLPGAYESFGVIPSVSSSVSGKNNYQPATGNIAILYSEYELVNFGLRKASVQNARSYTGMTQADLDRERYLMAAQIGRLFFHLLKTKYQLGVEQQNVLRYTAIDTVIRELTHSGLRPGADSSLAQAELSKARVTYNKQLGMLGQLTQQLSWLTGIPAGELVIDTTGKYFTLPDSPLLYDTTGSANNPLIGFYRQQTQYYRTTENMVSKSWLPKLLLSGAAWGRGSSIDYTKQYKDLATGVGFQRSDYMVSLTFAYNLIDPVHRRDKLAEARFRTQASGYEMQQEELDLNSAAAQAIERIKEAESNFREIPLQLRTAEEAYKQKIAQCKAGLTNLVDLTAAAYALYTAQTAYVETIDDWFLANLDKATATGNLDQFIQSMK